MNKLRINKFGILSVAKIYAVMMFVMSLLISIPYGLIIIVMSLTGASFGGGSEAFAMGGIGVIMGIAVMIVLPIVYAILGFIGGIIGAFIYNILAKMVGGIEIEVESIA